MNRRCLIQIGCTLICFFIYLTPAASRTCFLPDSEDCGEVDTNVSDISDVGSCRYYNCKDAGYKNDNPYQECYVENTVNIKNNRVSCYAVRCKMSQTACEEKAEGTNKCCNRDVASGCYYVGTCPKECDRSVYSYDSEQTGDGWTCISCHDGKGTFYKCNYDKTCEEQGYATSCSDEQIAEEVTSAKGQNGEKCYTCKGKPLSCPDGQVLKDGECVDDPNASKKTCADYNLTSASACDTSKNTFTPTRTDDYGTQCGTCTPKATEPNQEKCGIGYTKIEKDTIPTCFNTHLQDVIASKESSGITYVDSRNDMWSTTYNLPNGDTCAQCYCSLASAIDSYGGRLEQQWKLMRDGNLYKLYMASRNEAVGEPFKYSVSIRIGEYGEHEPSFPFDTVKKQGSGNYIDIAKESGIVKFVTNLGNEYDSSIKETCDKTDWNDGSCTETLAKYETNSWSVDQLNIIDAQFVIESKYKNYEDFKVILSYRTYSCPQSLDNCDEVNQTCYGDAACSRNNARYFWVGNSSIQSYYYTPGSWYAEVWYKGTRLAAGEVGWMYDNDGSDLASNYTYKDPELGKTIPVPDNSGFYDANQEKYSKEEAYRYSDENVKDNYNDEFLILPDIKGMSYASPFGVPFPALVIPQFSHSEEYAAELLAQHETTPYRQPYTHIERYNLVVPLGICNGMVLNIEMYSPNKTMFTLPLKDSIWYSNEKVKEAVKKKLTADQIKRMEERFNSYSLD